VAKLTPKLLTRGLELAALAAHSTRPSVLAESVNHRTPDSTLGERLELDPPRFVEAVGRVNQTDDAILDKIPNVYGMGHRRRDATR
jgi:hypothetical protein